MTAQTLIDALKRYPIPTACGVIVAACVLNLYFRSGMLEELESRLETVTRQVTQVDTNIVSGANLESHLEQMRTSVASLEKRIVRQADLAENLKYFYGLESETGVSLADLRQNAAPAKANSGVFVPVPYSVTLSGTFAQAVAYLDELENGSRFFRLRTFNLQRGRETQNNTVLLALNLELLGWP